MKWNIKQIKNIKLKEAIMLEGLPGIGNVGKIAVDFIIDSTKASKIYEITSDSFPNCVFINEDNEIELPKVEIFHKKINKRDLLLVSGDVQPIDESSSYEFCSKLVDIFKNKKGKEIITLGGIGLMDIPKNPKIFCTGTNKKIIDKYSAAKNSEMFGMIGPIIGVSGLLLGVAKQKNIQGVALLAETYGHPTYLGIQGAREILNLLNKKLNLNINIKELDKEAKEMEREINKIKNLDKVMKKSKKTQEQKMEFADYIG